MDIGMVGLGKMGGNMARRLLAGGHRVVVHDRDSEAVGAMVAEGAQSAGSIAGFASALATPRAVWIMVPAGAPTQAVIHGLIAALEPGDMIVDGGNSRYSETIERAAVVAGAGMTLVDVGTSGGVWGLAQGYSMMVGGDEAAVERLRPILETLAPAADRGWGRVGSSGAGHFVKMVHNGIEYGMMQAFAEGFAIMHARNDLDLDLHDIAEIWRHGSVVRSWLLDLIAGGLDEDQELTGIAPFVPDSGEGRWTVQEAIDLDVPAPVITLALIQRLRSRSTDSYADKLLSMMRHQFGGHAVEQAEDR